MELPLELELAIQNAPDDRAGYSVAADFWQQAGSPQGELVALSLAGDSSDEVTDRVIELKSKILPPEIRTLSPATIEWRWGVVHGAHISSIEDPSEPRMLRDLLASPLARFLQKLVIDRATQRLLDSIFDAVQVEPRALRCLRTLMLFLDREASPTVDLARLSTGVPTLRRLALRMAGWTGALALPQLLELSLAGVDDPTKLVARADLPRLDTLMINGDVGNDPNRWLAPGRLPALRWIELTSEPIDASAWQGAHISAQLEQLDRFDVTRGEPSLRSFLIDRRTRAPDAQLVVMVGRSEYRPGTVIPIGNTPFTIGGTGCSLVTQPYARGAYTQIRRRRGWTIHREPERYSFVNGHFIADECELRSMDEIAVEDYVFRFIEGDGAEAVRTRYALNV